ncbi:TPA: 50S ribosomal protein L19e [Candidatus Woesearchaeota archaeon]|nr:50S ribosomal protein L19e [Candidatus Woesearchaeota archaeon]
MIQKKQLAAKIMKTSAHKVRIAEGAQEDVQKAITRSDIRGLIAVGKIFKARVNEQSRSRARGIASQKRKGRRKGRGTHEGKKHAIVSRKRAWVTRIRVQRGFLRQLREKGLLSHQNYQQLYLQCKGGLFRNKRHVKLYITEHNLLVKKLQ